MRVPITIYKNSVLATILGIVAGLTLAGGVVALLSRELVGGIILIALGLGIRMLAEYISEKKQFKKWIRQLEENDALKELPTSNQFAVKLYNAHPTNSTIKYIEKYNPQAAQLIREKLAEQKRQAKENK